MVDKHRILLPEGQARFVRDEGVAGSNPATPTTLPANRPALPDSFPDRNSGPWSRELIKAIAMDIGKEAVHHLETMYPAAVAACPATMKLSLRNHIHNEIMAAIEVNDEGQIVARLRVRKERRRKIKAAYKKIREPRR